MSMSMCSEERATRQQLNWDWMTTTLRKWQPLAAPLPLAHHLGVTQSHKDFQGGESFPAVAEDRFPR